MFFWRKPVGSSRDVGGHQFCTFWHHFWPVGIQSGTNFRVFGTTFGLGGKQLKSPKNVPCKNAFFFMNLAASRHWCPTGSRLNLRTHSRTYFPLPRPTLAPIFFFRAPAVHQYPPSCTKTAKAVLSQTGVLQLLINKYIYIYNMCIYIYIYEYIILCEINI